MAQNMDYYVKQADKYIDPSYGIRTNELNDQIAKASNDPYYTSLLEGLSATKDREFSGIESRAAQRGVAYGNIPSQAQGKYLGEKYLPAVAEVKKTQMDYINNLKMKLADLKAARAEAATEWGFKLRESDLAREEAARDRYARLKGDANDNTNKRLLAFQSDLAKAIANPGDYIDTQYKGSAKSSRESLIRGLYAEYNDILGASDIGAAVYKNIRGNWEGAFNADNFYNDVKTGRWSI